MKKRACGLCGVGVRRDVPYPTKREFDGQTFAADVPATKCDTCGEVLISGPGLVAFDRAVTVRLAHSGKVGPRGFRWLRGAAGLEAKRLAGLLDVTAGTVSRWENGKQTLDRRAIALVCALALQAGGEQPDPLALLEGLAAKKRPPRRVQLDLRQAG